MPEFDWYLLENGCPNCGGKEFKSYALQGEWEYATGIEITHRKYCYEENYTLKVECEACEHVLFDREDEVSAAICAVLGKEPAASFEQIVDDEVETSRQDRLAAERQKSGEAITGGGACTPTA